MVGHQLQEMSPTNRMTSNTVGMYVKMVRGESHIKTIMSEPSQPGHHVTHQAAAAEALVAAPAVTKNVPFKSMALRPSSGRSAG